MINSRYRYANYTRRMSEKDADYQMLIREAKNQRLKNKRATDKEAELYERAYQVCKDIVDLNSDPWNDAVRELWEERRRSCKEKYREVVEELAPEPESYDEMPEYGLGAQVREEKKTSGDTKESAASDTASDSGKQNDGKSRNATKEISQEMIDGWYKKEPPEQSFKDVMGMDKIKEKLIGFVESGNWKKTQKRLKMDPTLGFFFYGPPGCGKTFMIEAFIHELMVECGYKCLFLRPGDVLSGLVGTAEKIVKAVFAEAVDNEPCIVFIDEIDAICQRRDGKDTAGHSKSLTTAFLIALTEFYGSKKKVIFVGATNYPDRVDMAMIDRVELIQVDLPDVDAREQYFKRQFEGMDLEDGYTFRDMAEATNMYSYRDCERIVKNIKPTVLTEVTQENKVFNEDNRLNVEATDEKASQALSEGKYCLTREMFQEVYDSILPSSKTEILEQLKVWTEKAREAGGKG